jgi:hypothetical protein
MYEPAQSGLAGREEPAKGMGNRRNALAGPIRENLGRRGDFAEGPRRRTGGHGG